MKYPTSNVRSFLAPAPAEIRSRVVHGVGEPKQQAAEINKIEVEVQPQPSRRHHTRGLFQGVTKRLDVSVVKDDFR